MVNSYRVPAQIDHLLETEHCFLYLTLHYSSMIVKDLAAADLKAKLIAAAEEHCSAFGKEGEESELEADQICHRSLQAECFDNLAAVLERRVYP